MSNLLEDQNSSTSFLRQRRDLFVVSAFLLLKQIALIKPIQDITFFGTHVTIEKPSVLSIAVWLLWLYWYIRYYQAFRKMSAGPLSRAYRDEIANLAAQKFRKKARNETKKLVETVPEFKGEVYEPLISESSLHPADLQCSWTPQAKIEGTVTPLPPERKITIAGRERFFLSIKVIWNVFINRMEFTEYIFPFVFGLLPALYWGYFHLT